MLKLTCPKGGKVVYTKGFWESLYHIKLPLPSLTSKLTASKRKIFCEFFLKNSIFGGRNKEKNREKWAFRKNRTEPVMLNRFHSLLGRRRSQPDGVRKIIKKKRMKRKCGERKRKKNLPLCYKRKSIFFFFNSYLLNSFKTIFAFVVDIVTFFN